MPASNFQAAVADSQLRIGARLGEDLLDLLAVELDVIESEFGGEEVAQEGVADFGSVVGGQTAADVLIALLVESDVEGRGVSVVEIVEVGMEVGHVIYHQRGQLSACSLHCSLAVVKETEI